MTTTTRLNRTTQAKALRAGRGGYGTVWPWVLGLAVGFGLVWGCCAGNEGVNYEAMRQ